MAAIPASTIVNITPSVIDAGGDGLDLIGLILTASTRVPIGTVVSLGSLAAVTSYFGAGSTEEGLATIYFSGYDNSPRKPGALLFAQYPTATYGVGAYLRGGNVSALTLTQLQAMSGTINLTVDGRSIASSTAVLNAVTSFSQAATVIQTAINDQAASFTGVIAVTTGILTASSVTGTIAQGQNLTGTGVPAGTTIEDQISGTPGGAGTYNTSISTAVASTAMKSGVTTVTYDSVSGAFIVASGTPGASGTITYPTAATALTTGLKLTAATGAVLSQGAAIGVPATNMNAIYAQTQNFASFMTAFQPSSADSVAFAAWNNTKPNRFLYAMSDANVAPTIVPDTTSAGYQIRTLGYSGIFPIYDPANAISLAAGTMGTLASIDFGRVNGRLTVAFRSVTGLTAGVTDETIADNLIANGYNFYGRYATANDSDSFFYPGSVTGDFDWADSYFNQIWLNNAFQRALMDMLVDMPSVPFNVDGYSLIETSLADSIQAALNFGVIRAGVPLSSAQAAQVNTAAGMVVSDVIQQRGWYLQVTAPSAAVRAARGSPICNFWYTDGQSVQVIDLSSVLVQ